MGDGATFSGVLPLGGVNPPDDRATYHWSRAGRSTRQTHVAWEEILYDVPDATFRSRQWHIPFVYRFQQWYPLRD